MLWRDRGRHDRISRKGRRLSPRSLWRSLWRSAAVGPWFRGVMGSLRPYFIPYLFGLTHLSALGLARARTAGEIPPHHTPWRVPHTGAPLISADCFSPPHLPKPPGLSSRGRQRVLWVCGLPPADFLETSPRAAVGPWGLYFPCIIRARPSGAGHGRSILGRSMGGHRG